MPVIMPIKDLRNTSEISDIAHKIQEPIFITKKGYSDLVVMSSELYDKFVKNNRIDQAIYESEKEMEVGGVSIGLAYQKNRSHLSYTEDDSDFMFHSLIFYSGSEKLHRDR